MLRERRFLELICLLIFATALSGCSRERWETEDPADALKLFVGAVYYSNTELAWRFLPGEVQSDLSARLKGVKTEADEDNMAHQLIMSSGFVGPHRFARVKIKPGSGSEGEATLLVETHQGGNHQVRMIKEEGVWRVGLKAPSPGDKGAKELRPAVPVKAGSIKPVDKP